MNLTKEQRDAVEVALDAMKKCVPALRSLLDAPTPEDAPSTAQGVTLTDEQILRAFEAAGVGFQWNQPPHKREPVQSTRGSTNVSKLIAAVRSVLAAAKPASVDAQPASGVGDLPPLPAPIEIQWPELHSQALGCGVEDRNLHDRYECAEYGWQDGVDRAASCVPDDIYTSEQMHEYALAAIAQRTKEQS
jgi:hypothetical protein